MTDGTTEAPASVPSGRPPRRRRSDRFDGPRTLTLALGVAGGLVLAQLVTATAARLRGLLVLVLLSLFFSFAMEPAVQWLHQRGVRRGLGTALVFLGVALLGGGLVASMYGLVVAQVTNLVESGPQLLEGLAARAQELPEQFQEPVAEFLANQAEQLPSRADDVAAVVGRQAVGVGTTLLGTLVSGLAVLLLTFYMVADGPRLRWQLSRRLDPARQREFLRVWELAIAKTGGYVYSRVLLAVVSAGVHVVAFQFAGLPYATALGVWVGVISSIVPVVGLYIAGILPVVVALANPDDTNIVVVVLVITIYQQIENYLVQPRVTAHSLSLHPAVAFLSVLVGAALLGPVGALLALPVAAIAAALVTAYAEEHDVAEHRLTTGPDEPVVTRTGRRRRSEPAPERSEPAPGGSEPGPGST